MQNIPPLEQVLNKGKEKRITSLNVNFATTVDFCSLHYISKCNKHQTRIAAIEFISLLAALHIAIFKNTFLNRTH